ncbi:hypothetical protein AAG570_010366, partial [Ranatra chinensis]
IFSTAKYIGTGCNRNDPNLNDCVVRKGSPAIKKVVQGDPEYRIPRLEPLVIDSLSIGRGTKQVGLVLTCTNCTLYGLQNTKFVRSEVNLKNKTCVWHMELDKLEVRGKYNVTGKVLLLPITGNGKAKFTFSKIVFSYAYDWILDKKSNGFEYVNIQNGQLKFKVGKMTIDLENLFNGDKLLGENMNKFLNENWQEILKDIQPALVESLSAVFKTILNAMAELVPYDNMFPND